MFADLPPSLAVWALAGLCVALMGFAIQRGATCTVAAIDEVVNKRRATRLASLLEASAWVAGGLLVVQHLQGKAPASGGYALGAGTVAGAVLLGLGAYVNRACVFGAIARLGSGEWAYVATPLGFYLGCLSLRALLRDVEARPLSEGSALLAAPAGLAWLFVAFVFWRGFGVLRARAWSAHAATIVIAITFLATLLLAGAWAYTDVLAQLASGMANNVVERTALLLCLLGGALWGGRTAARWRAAWPSATAWARCLIGGVLMGWGSMLIPGSNDGLILLGLPLLWPYAWVSFAAMCATIALAMLIARRWSWSGQNSCPPRAP